MKSTWISYSNISIFDKIIPIAGNSCANGICQNASFNPKFHNNVQDNISLSTFSDDKKVYIISYLGYIGSDGGTQNPRSQRPALFNIRYLSKCKDTES